MKIIFKILDYITAALMGVGTVYFVSLAVSTNWNVFIAMIAGMVIGMAVLLFAVLLFSSFSTAFEIFPVGMIITMFTGMGAGMILSMEEPDFTLMLTAAIAFSLFSQLCIDLYNMRLKGEVPLDK
jgi:hypothetical protein